MTSNLVARLLHAAPGQRILVAGDAMLDAYVSGHATRISPEAPVPVVGVSGRRYVPGGAANVAANIRALGAEVCLAGVTGVDEPAIRLRRELERQGIDMAALVEDPARVTTIKTRITAAGQQIVRFDEEDVSPLPGRLEADLLARAEALLSSASITACVISDYAKGVVSASFSRHLIAAAVRMGKPVVVDPKSSELGRYAGATVITPNLKEAAAAAGAPLPDSASLIRAGAELLRRTAPSALLVTRGGEGMSLFEPGQLHWPLAALNVEVADVTGAGDTVAAVLAAALGIGFSLREAATLANLAAGLAVRHAGTWAVQPGELKEAVTAVAEPA